jgi:hypothetical protein
MDHQVDPDLAFAYAVHVGVMVLFLALMAGLFYFGVLP